MAITTQSLRSERWRTGKRFIYLDNFTLPAGAVHDIAFGVPSSDIIIESVEIEANVENLSWEAFAGSVIVEADDTILTGIPRNMVAATKPNVEIVLNPVVLDPGQSMSGKAINLVAEIYRNNNYYLREGIITSDFVFQGGLAYLLRITNTSGAPTDIEITMSLSNT